MYTEGWAYETKVTMSNWLTEAMNLTDKHIKCTQSMAISLRHCNLLTSWHPGGGLSSTI